MWYLTFDLSFPAEVVTAEMPVFNGKDISVMCTYTRDLICSVHTSQGEMGQTEV